MPQSLDLKFPLAGLNRKFAYRSQPPFSAPAASNVRPRDPLEGRDRGGSRPGLAKFAQEQLGSGNPIRMLATLSYLANDGMTYWTDEFQGTSMGTAWSAASWLGTSVPSILPDNVTGVSYGTSAGAVRTAIASLDTTKAYQLELDIVPYQGAHHGTYYLFARMNDTTPVGTTDGAVAALTITGATGIYSGSLTVYVAGVATTYAFTGGTTGYAATGKFKMLINGNTVTCYWLGNTLKSQAISAAAGARVGFGMTPTVAGGICLCDSFRAQYYLTGVVENRRTMLIASANGKLYKETTMGTMAEVTSNLTLASDRNIQAVEHLQKLYIADHGNPRITGTGGTIDATGLQLDDAGVADWTTKGIDPHDDVVVITNGTGAVVNGTYQISTVAADYVTLTATAGGAGTCAYRIERAPKIYDPATNALTLWTATAAKGQVPSGAPIIARYRDRLVLIKDNVWYMSRQGDPLDWDYAASGDDTMRAVAGSSADTGRVGEMHTAGIAHSDDYMILGCENSVWVLRGDPAYGGQLDNLTRDTGIVDKAAWCRDHAGNTYWLGRNGLYRVTRGAESLPERVSDSLPRELQGISATSHSISLAYDSEAKGLHIFLTKDAATSRDHFFFSLAGYGFWPESFQSDHEPYAALCYAAQDAIDTGLILGCRDGYLRRFRDTAETDEASTITSYIVYGPIPMGDVRQEGLLMELWAALGRNSGSVTWSIYTGSTPEEAVYATTAFATGTWVAGLNYKERPNMRGYAMCLKAANAGARAWAIESICGLVREAGELRKP